MQWSASIQSIIQFTIFRLEMRVEFNDGWSIVKRERGNEFSSIEFSTHKTPLPRIIKMLCSRILSVVVWTCCRVESGSGKLNLKKIMKKENWMDEMKAEKMEKKSAINWYEVKMCVLFISGDIQKSLQFNSPILSFRLWVHPLLFRHWAPHPLVKRH